MNLLVIQIIKKLESPYPPVQVQDKGGDPIVGVAMGQDAEDEDEVVVAAAELETARIARRKGQGKIKTKRVGQIMIVRGVMTKRWPGRGLGLQVEDVFAPYVPNEFIATC